MPPKETVYSGRARGRKSSLGIRLYDSQLRAIFVKHTWKAILRTTSKGDSNSDVNFLDRLSKDFSASSLWPGSLQFCTAKCILSASERTSAEIMIIEL